MSIIQVTPERLYSEAERLLKLKSLQEAEMNKLRLLVKGLDGQWKGEAQKSFVAEFNSMEYSFGSFSSLIAAYADLMKSSANQLQQTDRNMKDRIRRI